MIGVVLRLFVATSLVGCAASSSVAPRLETYDSDLKAALEQQLLLNIAREARHLPVHFALVTSVADTNHTTFSGGIGPIQTTGRPGFVAPSVAVTEERNPTVSIAPMQGDDYARQLLTPFTEAKVALLLRQGVDVDALLRLLGDEVVLGQSDGPRTTLRNRPSDRESYIAYRRFVAQLSSIQDRRGLRAQPITLSYSWTVPAAEVTPERFASTYKDYVLKLDERSQTYQVTRRVIGRYVITNYDPAQLSFEERASLQAEAERASEREILVDIRHGYVGDELEFHGRVALRSFRGVLSFVARGMSEEPEFAVPPDPRTPPIAENPSAILGISIDAQPAAPDAARATLDGVTYSVAPDVAYPWNRKAFALLAQLFQLSLTVGPNASPQLLIPK